MDCNFCPKTVLKNALKLGGPPFIPYGMKTILMNRITNTLKTGIVLLISTSLGWTAAPPAQKTPEELMWTKLSVAAQQNLSSNESLGLMKSFIKSHPNHAKAVDVRYLLSERTFKEGNYKEAAVGFEKFLLLNPEHELSDSAAYRVGECYYNLGAYNSALASWEKLLKNYGKSSLVPNALEGIATIHMRAREWGRADVILKQLAGDYPAYAKKEQIRAYTGIVEYYLDHLSEAAQTLQDVDIPHAAYFRGLSLFSLKLYEDSVQALNTALSGSKLNTYAESAVFLKAESFFKKKNYNLASKEFLSFSEKYPNSPLSAYADLRRATCLLLVRDLPGALAICQRLINDTVPTEVERYVVYAKASILVEQKSYGEAAALLSKLTQQKDMPDLVAGSLVRLAWCQKNLGDENGFEDASRRLIEKFPSHPEMPLALYVKGVRSYEKERWEDAGKQFENAVLSTQYNSLSEASLALMAISYSKAKRYDQLVTAANSALKILEGHFASQDPYWRAQSYYFIGDGYYALNRFKDAGIYYEKIATKFADSELAPRAHLMLGWCYIEQKIPSKARENALALLENKKTPKDLMAPAAFLKAVSFFNLKDYDPSIVAFTEFIKAHPSSELAAKAQYLMGLAYHQKKKFGSAVEEWEKLISKYPSHPLSQEAYLYIGDLTFKSGDYERASKTFRAFREKWPNSQYRELTMWQELQAYFNGKMDETAIQVYPKFIEMFPNSENIEDAKKQLDLVYYRRGAHGDPAKLNEFLSKYPKSPFAPAARYKLGDMAMEQKSWPRAVSEMEQFVRDYPGDPMVMNALYAMGLAYENMGEVDKAIVTYQNLMTQFSTKPNAVDAAFRLGSLHFKRERYGEAVQAFEFTTKKKMSKDLKANVYFNLGLAYENLGQLEKAAQAYNSFTQYSTNKEQLHDALMDAGLLMKKAGQYTQAAGFIQRALKEGSNNTDELEGINLLAECYKEGGNATAAITAYRRLIGIEPADNDLRLGGLAQLAYLYEQKKDYKNAVQIYEQISVSGGKAEWVNAAKTRVTELMALLNPAP